MPDSDLRKKWRPGKKDLIFAGIVAVVMLALILGSGERRTAATPNDETHMNVTSRSQCMTCHDAKGVRPWSVSHPSADQCFQCHAQPQDWKGGK